MELKRGIVPTDRAANDYFRFLLLRGTNVTCDRAAFLIYYAYRTFGGVALTPFANLSFNARIFLSSPTTKRYNVERLDETKNGKLEVSSSIRAELRGFVDFVERRVRGIEQVSKFA